MPRGLAPRIFTVGDALFGTTTMLNTGAYAEYVCLPEQWKHGVIGPKPENVSFKEAAALPVGAMTALFLLEKACIASGQSVLVYGASGSVGTYAVQIAIHFGATVTGVCSSTNTEMVESLGAAKVIDYTRQDYTSDGLKYDIVFDAVGKTTKSKAQSVLKKGGAFVSINMFTSEKKESLLRIKRMVETGALKAVIDKCYALDNIVEAHRYVDSGRKRGNLVIQTNPSGNEND